MNIRLIFSAMIYTLLSTLALNAQVWSAAIENDLAVTLNTKKEENKPIIQAPKQNGAFVQLVWSSNFVKLKKSSFEIRLYEALEDAIGNTIPNLNKKPIIADFTEDRQYQINGKDLGLLHGQEYCFVISPNENSAITDGVLPENATVSKSFIWYDTEKPTMDYPICAKPTDLTVTETNFDNFKVQWRHGEPNQIERFDIYLYKNNLSSTPIITQGSTIPLPGTNNFETVINGLEPNTFYYVRLKAKCLSNDILSDWASIKGNTDGYLSAKTKNPCVPLPLFVESNQGCGIQVSWQNPNNYNVISLVVKRYDNLGNEFIDYNISSNDLIGTSHVFDELLDGQTYTFNLSYSCTYNGNIVNTQTITSENVTQGCTHPKIASLNACKVRLEWQNPNNFNCQEVKVVCLSDNTQNQSINLAGLGVSNSFEIENLLEGKVYAFDLIYECGDNEKRLKFPSVTIPTSCDRPPIIGIRAVENNKVIIDYVGNDDLSVCYTGLTNSSGGSVLYKKNDKIPYIQPLASYTFFIAKGGCPNNCTSGSDCPKNRIEEVQFTMPCASPTRIYYQSISSQSIKIAWEEALPATVRYQEVGSNSWTTPVAATGSFEVQYALSPNTEYEFEVAYANCSRALSTIFKTPASDICLGNPQKSDVNYSNITKTSIQLNIKPFDFNNEYEYQYQDAADANNPWSAISRSRNTFTIGQLVAGTTYNIRVRRFVDGLNPTHCAWLLLDPVSTEDLVCPALILVPDEVRYETGDNYIKITWNDLKSPKTYNINYRVEGVPEWTTVNNVQGLTYTIQELLNNTTYEIQIRRACTDTNSDWVNLDKQKTKTKKTTTVPEPDCGQVVNAPKPPAGLTNIPAIDKLSENDIFYYNGFEIKITKFDNNQQTVNQGPFSGKGEMGLPFGKKKLKVNFSNISVNQFQLGSGGSVTAVSDNTLNVQGTSIALNSFTCDPPPVKVKENPDGTYGDPPKPHDPNGFNKAGQYIGPLPDCLASTDQKDPMRDPRGFNKQGLHLNGTPYDENGCDINGLKADKQPCSCYKPCEKCNNIKPYGWLNDNSDVTNEGNVFAEAQKTQIKQWIPVILDSLKTDLGLKIGAILADCDAKRPPMLSQISTLNYNQQLTFGTNDKYFKEKMSAEFIKTPVALTGSNDRKAGAEDFEKKHIELYNCDLKLADARALSALIEFYYSDPSEREKIESYVFEKARRLSKEKVEEFKSEKKFKVWVVEQVMDFIKAEFRAKYGKDYGFVKPNRLMNETPSFPAIEKPLIRPYQKGLASNEMDYQLLQDATSADLKDAVFQYEQGWEYINGIHRTSFYEAIAKLREQMTVVEEAQAMPISFGKTLAGVTYTMYLDNFFFNGSTGSIDAYMVITLQDGQKVVFKGTGLAFNRNGLITTATSGPKLFLLTDIAYGINRIARIKLKGQNGQTYVEWDCEGFRSLHTQVDIEFCRQYMKPLDASGNVIADPDKMVTLSTELNMSSWGDFEVEIAKEQKMNFVMTGYEDYKINVSQIIIDNSTTMAHNTNITFPSNYGSETVEVTGTEPNTTAKALPAWKGIFIGGISVKLPTDVIKTKSGQAQVGVEKMIIDNEGVTGVIFAKVVGQPIVPIDDGSLDGWAYSVDGIHLNVMQNHIVGGGFDGLLNIPILSHKDKTTKTPRITKEDCFNYRADYIVGLNKFTFTVMPETEKVFNFDMLKAKITLSQNSRIDLVLQNGKFVATAVLHGNIAMSGKLDPNKEKRNLGALAIDFKDFKISNIAPRFKGGTFEMPKSPQLFKKYGLTYHTGTVRPSNSDDKIAIMDLDVDFHLSKGKDITLNDGTTKSEDPTKLAAHGGFEIRGIMENDDNGRQRFVYQNFVVKSVEVNGSFPGVAKIHGYITFFEEGDPDVAPKFGEGFQGGLDVSFDKLGFQAKAVGLFGTVNDYKYFCVDAMIYKDGLFNIAGVMDVNGFGGGAYYHMSRDTTQFNDFTMDKDTPIPTKIGQSLTGIHYEPDNSKLIGIRAMMAFSLAKAKSAVNGNVLFGVEFNSNFGLSEVMLAGNANIMTPISSSALPKFVKDKGDPQTAAIRASILLLLKFGAQPEFHCNSNVYMNVGDLLVGNSDPLNSPELMGGIDIYVGKGKWHFNLGEPQIPVSIGLMIPGTQQPAVSLKTYMNIGNDLKDMPPLPDFIQKATGAGYKPTPSASRNSGAGFAFGANLSINTGDRTFLIFYGKFQAELGFDVMLKNYGATTTCSNLGNKPIGMNGWYATGQMYAGVQAEIGLKWKSRKFEIMNIYAAVALQAKMPNPFWAQGSVGGYYSILGGLKKGQCSFQMTIGEECVLPAGSDPNLLVQKKNIIQAVSPSNNDEEFSVLSAPIIELNYPLDVTIKDEDNGKNYFTEFDSEPTLKTKDGYTIPFILVHDASRAKVEIQPLSILDGNTEMILNFTVKMEENGQEVLRETKEVHFKTAAPEMKLPYSNITTTYPTDGQHNFYLQETSEQKGYIYLRLGQGYLFKSTEAGKDVVHKMRFTAKSGNCFMTKVEYINGERLIKFDMPANKFQKGMVYKMDLITIAKADDSPTACVPDAKVIRSLYTAYFRTSTYDNVTAKINAAFIGQNQVNLPAPSYDIILPKANAIEPFDQLEITNSGRLKSFLKFNIGFAQSLPKTMLDALNNVTGTEPYIVKFAINDNDVRQYPLTLDFSQVGGIVSGQDRSSRQNGQRAVVGEAGGTGYSIPTFLRIIQDNGKIPYIKSTDFSGPTTLFNEPQYLRFDAVNGTFEQIEALQKGIMNLKEDIVLDLMKDAGFTDRVSALDHIESSFDNDNNGKYEWLNWILNYKINRQTGKIPATATYTPPTRNVRTTTIEFNK